MFPRLNLHMKILLSLLAITLLAAPLVPTTQAREVSTEFFYQQLDPFGDWIQTADYGYVWHPRDVDENWRPYTVGSWAYTDAGWTWVSDEPFGAITYHYGRWTQLGDVGWSWVPEKEWGPAWVSWRRSNEYVGWAPLPPEASFQREVGISQWADSYYDIGPTHYAFVRVAEFGSPSLARVVLPPRENVTVIRETRNITHISYRNDVVYDDGPEYDVVVRESREPVRRLRLERREDVIVEDGRPREGGLRATVAGGALRIFAPTVAFSPDVAPTRVARRVERVEVNRGWRNVDQAQAQELRTHLQRDTPRPPAQLPAQPVFTRAATANPAATRSGNARPETSRTSATTPAAAPAASASAPAATETSPSTTSRAVRPGGARNPAAEPGTTPATTAGGSPAETMPAATPGGRVKNGTSSKGGFTPKGGTPPERVKGPSAIPGEGATPAERGASVEPSTPVDRSPGTRKMREPGAEPSPGAGAPDAPRSGHAVPFNGTSGTRAEAPGSAAHPEGTPAREPGHKPEKAVRPETTARPEASRPESAPRSETPRSEAPRSEATRPGGAPPKPEGAATEMPRAPRESRPETSERPHVVAPAGSGEPSGIRQHAPGAEAPHTAPGAKPAGATPAAASKDGKKKGEKGEKPEAEKPQ